MPALSGLDLCRAVRADPELRGLPIVVLTARGLPEDRAAALEAGADRFLTKPFRPSDLLAAVGSLADSGPSEGLAGA
jgi:CheY-like chemotaxis protein